MRADAIFSGTVKGGQLKLDDSLRWRAQLARYEGRRISISVRPEWKGRSLSQNAYLWGVVYRTIAEWSGHEDEEIHEAMKDMFLPNRELLLPDGDQLPARLSTKVLGVEEFSDYVSKVKAWAGGHGLYIPAAGEVEVSL